jgi:hypothetical protein
MVGIMDGVSLSHFVPGLTYEVSDSLGGYLITTGAAEEVFGAANQSDPDESVTDSSIFGGISVTWPTETAADTLRATTRRSRKRR